ncbi:MAG TPA: lipid-binding SYLF domain-containing protein [Alphaproteobacteria bacterium]|nr:lipid-binding SYLF domain-containing protein [Alphaproteobacteria bacterium]
MLTERIEQGPFRLSRRRLCASAALVATVVAIGPPSASWAATAAEIDADANNALDALLKENEGARALADQAKGILIFPSIVKGGLIVGGAYGEGALRVGGKSVGYYNSVAGSVGLQAGVQSFSYALFFMTDEALNYVKKSEGWEIGVGPTVVVADEGFAASASSTTLQAEIYAFIFGQEGLMAGLSIEGSKITQIER